MERIRILLVDDERMVRLGLRMRLGCEADMTVVGEAENGKEALSEVAALMPDVVVLDFQMPGLDGLDTLRQARASGCCCSFVMLSGYDSSALGPLAIAAGASAFVGKYEPDTALLSAIRRAASGRPGLEHPS